MQERLNLIIVLDDNLATNFIHKKIIAKTKCVEHLLDFQSGTDVLAYLRKEKNSLPDILFIDINMPVMDAWEFLSEYEKIKRKGLSDVVIILLSSAISTSDIEKGKKNKFIKEIRIKPLSAESIHEIITEYFPK